MNRPDLISLPLPVDVVVLGGGPAGIAVALALTRVGRSVMVLERSRYESVRIGETFPPEIRLPLAELGLWEPFLADGHCTAPGIVSAWGETLPRDRDFLWNPYGEGWHVDRRRFDEMLARAAENHGVEVLRAARVTAWERVPGSAWHLQVVTGGVSLQIRAAALVDATGRASSPVRSLGGPRIVVDRLIGLVNFAAAGPHASNGDRRTLVESVEEGWWYSALLPGDRHVAVFMTDADLIPRSPALRCAFWRERLRTAPLTRSRLDLRMSNSCPRLVAAHTSRLTWVASDGRIAVGDAAAALDPLSSQGVYRALISGLEAARAVDASLRGDRAALADYARQVGTDFRGDLEARAHYYSQERRWPRSLFWRRRQGLPERPG